MGGKSGRCGKGKMWGKEWKILEREDVRRKNGMYEKREDVGGKDGRYGKGKMWEERVADIEKVVIVISKGAKHKETKLKSA